VKAPPFPLGPALWEATAATGPRTLPFEGAESADVAIVGGGYAGLSAALRLREYGLDVALLEARDVGWGASGRNGGQVIPGLKHDPDELLRLFGPQAGEALAAFAGTTADGLFAMIRARGLDVPHVRAGWIQAAHGETGVAAAKARAAQWARRGVPARFLDRDEAAALLGTNAYRGGWLDPRGGAVQPLALARELARAAIAAGARVHGASPATALRRKAAGWLLTTQTGATLAVEKVIVCANAYADGLVPGVKRSLIAPNSFQFATAPLPPDIRASILPQGHVASDTRNLLFYYRLDADGRLVFGGRGPFREPRGPEDWRHLEAAARRMFAQIGDAPAQFRWCGRVAVTRDSLPHVHAPAPGLLVNAGCQGRGVALQVAMGAALADFSAEGVPPPIPLTKVRPIPLHGLRRAYAAAAVAWYRWRDARAEA
jgi:glycine/D-amino acid oxidase-like deaminating enzyme